MVILPLTPAHSCAIGEDVYILYWKYDGYIRSVACGSYFDAVVVADAIRRAYDCCGCVIAPDSRIAQAWVNTRYEPFLLSEV